MSENETTEMWREHRQHVQKQRNAWLEKELPALRRATIPLVEKNFGSVVILRAEGWPKVDFWPSSGFWMIPGQKDRHYGDARAFINWCLKNRAKP